MANVKCLIDIVKIYVPERFRKHGPESIARMSKNLKERGQFHDIMVTPLPQDSPLRQQGFEYELVEGGLRLAGAKAAGWAQISCMVRESVSDGEKALIMIEENETRDNLTPLDQGNSYLDAMKANNWSIDQLAAHLGKTRGYVNQFVVIAKQSDKVKEVVTRVTIGISHLEIIMRLATDEAKIAMIERCAKEDLSVKQLEILVNKALAASPGPAGQEEAVKKADGGPAAKPQPKLKGIKLIKSGKGFNFGGGYKTLIPMDDFIKEAKEAYQALLDEQAQAELQETQKSQARKSGKADAAKIDNIKKAIKSTQDSVKVLEKLGRDTSGKLKEIEDLKVLIAARGGGACPGWPHRWDRAPW